MGPAFAGTTLKGARNRRHNQFGISNSLDGGANQHYSDSVPSHRGRLAIVTNAGGMRWTRGAFDDGAFAYGQVVSF